MVVKSSMCHANVLLLLVTQHVMHYIGAGALFALQGNARIPNGQARCSIRRSEEIPDPALNVIAGRARCSWPSARQRRQSRQGVAQGLDRIVQPVGHEIERLHRIMAIGGRDRRLGAEAPPLDAFVLQALDNKSKSVAG